MAALELPSGSSYMCSILISLLPKTAVIVFSIIITSFRTELFSAELANRRNPLSEDRDLPLAICYYEEANDDIYGDRICNNAMAASVISIIIAIVLLVIDLHVPCVSSTFSRMAHFLSVFWSIILAVYWLISGAFLSNLYERYCDNLESSNAECNDTDEKFILLPCMAFFCMVTWILQAAISFLRWMFGK